MDEATVEITSCISAAERVDVLHVHKGDLVFDTTGGTHAVRSTCNLASEVRIIREDGVRSYHPYGETITIIRKQA